MAVSSCARRTLPPCATCDLAENHFNLSDYHHRPRNYDETQSSLSCPCFRSSKSRSRQEAQTHSHFLRCLGFRSHMDFHLAQRVVRLVQWDLRKFKTCHFLFRQRMSPCLGLYWSPRLLLKATHWVDHRCQTFRLKRCGFQHVAALTTFKTTYSDHHNHRPEECVLASLT